MTAKVIKKIKKIFKKNFEKGQHPLARSPGGGVCQTVAQAPNLEFFKFSFLRFIAFLENFNFEFFKFGTLEKFCIFRSKKCKYFLHIKILFVSL